MFECDTLLVANMYKGKTAKLSLWRCVRERRNLKVNASSIKVMRYSRSRNVGDAERESRDRVMLLEVKMGIFEGIVVQTVLYSCVRYGQ